MPSKNISELTVPKVIALVLIAGAVGVFVTVSITEEVKPSMVTKAILDIRNVEDDQIICMKYQKDGMGHPAKDVRCATLSEWLEDRYMVVEQARDLSYGKPKPEPQPFSVLR